MAQEMRPAPGRKALLIGIDDYPALASNDQLEGSVRDVEALACLLIDRFQFAAADVEVLANRQATRAGILAALGRLLERIDPDDAVVLHYSGHGSRRAGGNRADGYQGVVVPYDSGRVDPHPNRDLTGSELYGWLRHLGAITRRVTLIFDCCCSGTITRELFAGRQRWIEADLRPVVPLPFPWRADAPRLPRRGQSGWFPVSESYTLLAACRSDESANEVLDSRLGVAHGALSFFLIHELADLRTRATYREILERVASSVTMRFPSQHPQLEGASDRLLFGLRESPPLLHPRVEERRGERVVLTCGAIHGTERGSTWAIRPDGAPARGPLLGEVEITSVRAVWSEAEVRKERTPGAVAAGAWAVLQEAADPFRSPAVAVETDRYSIPAAELRRGIERSPLLRLAAAPAEADLVVHLLDPGERAAQAAPKLRPLRRATCVVVDPRGEVVLPFRPIDEAQMVDLTLENLESFAATTNLRELRNTSADPLSGKVGFRILRREGSSWIPAEPSVAGAPVAFDHDREFALELYNDHHEPVFPYVLDVGLGGRVGLVYPFPGAREPLPARKRHLIGDRPGEELSFYVPAAYPFYDPGSSPAAGTQILKLLATLEETDLRPLFQPSYRSDADWRGSIEASALGRLLARICVGESREVGVGRSPEAAAWTTFEQPVLLRRRDG